MTKRFSDYLVDTKTKRAVERNIEIIGEAVDRILKKDKEFKLESAQKIIGTRNRIVHGYDKISDELIWSIVINNLPKLRKEVVNLLIKPFSQLFNSYTPKLSLTTEALAKVVAKVDFHPLNHSWRFNWFDNY
jgi:uncharacterized protein with HEPN domain